MSSASAASDLSGGSGLSNCQADALALEVIDTSTAALEESASILYDSIQRFSEVIAVDTQNEATSP